MLQNALKAAIESRAGLRAISLSKKCFRPK
jgi:hypothetical protein